MKRFLLLSDIHATDVDPSSSSAPSYVSSYRSASSIKTDPFAELEALFPEESDRPDFVLCAGDMTNRSHPSSFTYVWQRLNSLSNALGAKLISTIGNHDLDSRYQENKYDPRGYAMNLDPLIPFPDRTRYLEYWAENFTIISEDGCNFVVLNTAAYHGGGEDVKNELEHGRISSLTLARIESAIADAPEAPINILLCHHHPEKAEQSDRELEGQTRGGERLVESLGRSSHPWVVVHGHKHTPDLFYAHGGANSPVVIGCASFSSQVNADAQNKNPNQVHLLTCDPAAAAAQHLTIAGEVRSWTWIPGVGWTKAQGSHGLAHFTGFGYRASVRRLAELVDEHLATLDADHMGWKDAVAVIPQLERLIPEDFALLERELTGRSLALLSDRDGVIAQIGRST